jgi:hypothetical protein
MAIKLDTIFVEASTALTANYATTANTNSMTIGPITISNTVVLTVTANSVLVII